MTGNNPVDRSKLGTKRHILTDENGISLFAVITSDNKHDIKAVTDVIDDTVIKRPTTTSSFLSTTKQSKINQTCVLIEHIILNQ